MINRTHVMLSAFGIDDIPDARHVTVIRDRDLESFTVTRVRSDAGTPYTIENRTHFMRGSTAVRTLADVRRVIRSA